MKKHPCIFHTYIGLLIITTFIACDKSDIPFTPDFENNYDRELFAFKILSNFYHWPGKSGLVRAGVKLSEELKISSLEDSTEITSSGPWLGHLEDGYVVYFKYRWQVSIGNFVDVRVTVAESCKDAQEYFIRRCFLSSAPLEICVPVRDKPNLVGNISFNDARRFIRNNILVEIRAEGTMEPKIYEIARKIDSLLLASPAAMWVTFMKPRIIQFKIAQNPVKWRSMTRLIIDAHDPLRGELYYKWRFTPGVESSGGIETDDSGNYYYYAAVEQNIEKLTLNVINDAGFLSSATITIQIVDIE